MAHPAELFRELWVVSNVEVVMALLPEVLLPTQAKSGLEGHILSLQRW